MAALSEGKERFTGSTEPTVHAVGHKDRRLPWPTAVLVILGASAAFWALIGTLLSWLIR